MSAEQNAPSATRTKYALALCLFLPAGAAAYSNVLDSYFLSDDFAQVGRVLEGDLSVTWGREHGGFFRPLFVLSLLADASLWGRRQLGFHLTNVLVHALNSFLVVLVSLRLAEGTDLTPARRRFISLAAGLVFLLHPSHTEAVTWISGRADLLSSLFCLTALLLFISYTQTGRRPRLALALVSYVLALLSKESAACLPLVTFLAGCYLARARGGAGAVRQSLKLSAPFILLLAAYVAVRALALGTVLGGYGAEHHLNLSHSMIVSQLLRFPLRALFPANALRSFPFLESRTLSPVLIAIGCAVVVLLMTVLARRKRRAKLFAFLRANKFLWLTVALFLAALAPVINLRVDVFTTQGERFLYFPSAFASIALAYVIFKGATRARPRLAVFCLVLAVYTFALWRTNQHWAETGRLSRRILEGVVRLSARDEVLILNLPDNYGGAHLYRNGLPEALRTFQDAKALRRVHVLAWHAVRSPRDGAELTGEGAGVYTLRLTNDATTFGRVSGPPEFLEILDRSDSELRFRLRAADAPDILYFDGVGMIRVPVE